MSSAVETGDPTVHCISLQTPFAVGRVNTYLVEDDPLTLVDCGPNSGTSLVELRDGLQTRGYDLDDLQRIVITHQHIDHEGLAGILKERSGAEVVALDLLAPWLADYENAISGDDEWAADLMQRHGVADETGIALRSITSAFHAWGGPVEVTRTVTEGDTLTFADREWAVFHRPGHSPSDTVFHDAERRTLIGGDHLLSKISSNALVSRPLDGSDDHTHSLLTYRESLRKTREMDLDRVLGGHGEPVTGHRALIDDRFAAEERRAAKIAAMVAAQPLSAHAIAVALWGNVALTQAFLTISEVLGHVDLLLERGEVVEQDDRDVITFAAA